MKTNYSSPASPAEYRSKVWEWVKRIPTGYVATYGQIASLIQPTEGVDPRNFAVFGARWVGAAMAACPEGIPWQRVVNSKGEISLSPGSGGKLQRELLESEGIEFDEHGRINMKLYRWPGPSENELNNQQGTLF